MKKVYEGKCDNGRKTVTVDGRPLPPVYPPDRGGKPFEWGIESPGAFHLAGALLADCTGKRAPDCATQGFLVQHVSKFPAAWRCESEEIEKWLRPDKMVGLSVQQAMRGPGAGVEAAPSGEILRPSDLPNLPIDPLKQHRANWLDSLRQRIAPDELAKHGFPRPKDVTLSQSTDSTGEDAFYVFLVFPNKTPEAALAWKKIEPMVSWVRSLIWTETGGRLWPYVKVKRQKELAGGQA